MFCDLVEMDACHILLGIPWLFDMHVYHGSMVNTYEFRKNGQRYKVTPIVENAAEVTKQCGGTSMRNNNIMSCSAKVFL